MAAYVTAYPVASPVGSQSMNRDILDAQPNLFVKQTRKGWFQECLGCEANTEFKIATMANQQEDIMYAIENTSCCLRFWCAPLRNFTMTVSEGGVPGGRIHSFHTRPFRCPAGNCKCCCFQEMETKDENGVVIGGVIEDRWFCVPNYKVMAGPSNETGTHQFNMHMPTCCCGLCVDCCSQGCCSCRIPFYIYVPGKEGKDQQVGEIVKIWSGMKKEILTDADNFELRFPVGVDAQTKSRLLGATFLLNQLYFEGKN